MKHVAVYLRVSTVGEKNGREQSTEMQWQEINKFLEQNKIEDQQISVYEDVGYSGTKKERPALNRLMKDCRDGKVSMVVCYKLDRLFRSLMHMISAVSELQEQNVELIAVKDSINLDTATGKLLFHIMSCFAEFEAASIKERVLSGIANAKSKGIKLGPPFKKGHTVVKKLKSEGHSVREISEHTGLSTSTVYRSLKKEGQNG